MEQKEMISFDLADSGTNSHVMVSFLLDVGTFVEHLFLYCFDITTVQCQWNHCFSVSINRVGRKTIKVKVKSLVIIILVCLGWRAKLRKSASMANLRNLDPWGNPNTELPMFQKGSYTCTEHITYNK
jgi:hypothetical protein